jgi:epsilon-lactone hydrolase
MASDEMRFTAELIRETAAFGPELDVAKLRAQMLASAAALPDDVTRSDFDHHGLPACRIAAPEAREDHGLLYLHGGGYSLGSLDTHAELMGRLSRACRVVVTGIDYRLAPEHPYPAAIEDAIAGYHYLLGEGIPPQRIVLAGDSAGGGLALACLLSLDASGLPQPAGVALMSPWTDLTFTGESVRTRATVDPMISPEGLVPTGRLYHGAADPADPLISPLFGDLRDLAPMLIQVGDHEILLDDSTRLAERARAQGVLVELEVYDEAFHVFQVVAGLPESDAALASIGRFFDRVTG